jgi:hypothetical protein
VDDPLDRLEEVTATVERRDCLDLDAWVELLTERSRAIVSLCDALRPRAGAIPESVAERIRKQIAIGESLAHRVRLARAALRLEWQQSNDNRTLLRALAHSDRPPRQRIRVTG